MNAQQPVFGNIPIESIIPSKTNPRKRFPDGPLNDLAMSIKEQGLGQPILVRPIPDTKDAKDYVEIVAGERRYRASKIAGLKTIPAIVRVMTDIEAQLFQQVENLQREDVHPIEEAEGYERLMKDHGLTAEQCGEKIGKSKAYIYGRLKLCALIPDAREAFYDGKLNASTALLIARIPVATLQAKATKEIIRADSGAEPMSYRIASQHLQNRYMLNLDQARFALNDGRLVPAAGSCTDCPKRSGNAQDLFQDVAGADVCTDPDCFALKRNAHDAKILKSADKKNIKIVEVESMYDIAEAVGSDEEVVTLQDSVFYKFERVKNNNHKVIEDALPADQRPEPISYAKTKNGVEPVFSKSAMQEALEKAGLCETIDQHTQRMKDMLTREDPDAKAKAAAKSIATKKEKEIELRAATATKFRIEVFTKIRQAVLDAVEIDTAFRLAVKAVMEESSLPPAFREAYPFNSNDRKGTREFIDQASNQQLIVMLLDVTVGFDLRVDAYEITQKGYEKNEEYLNLIAMAKAFNVDVDAIRAETMPDPAVVEKKAKAKKEPAPKAEAAKPAPKKAKSKIVDPATAWPFPMGARP